MSSNAIFGRIFRTRRLDWCPTCEPEKSFVDGLAWVLAMRVGRWFTCACGNQWRFKAKTGVMTRPVERPAVAMTKQEEAL